MKEKAHAQIAPLQALLVRAICVSLLIAASWSAPRLASAQTAEVVSACGTPNETYNRGQHMPTTQDGTGTLCTKGGSSSGAGGNSNPLVSSTLTRPANTTAYAGTATAPVAVCANTSVTICAPLTFTVSSTVTVNGYITRLALLKSTTGATGATFVVQAYMAAPTLTSTFDTTSYTPLATDISSGA